MTVEPPAGSPDNRAYKGPFIACELLTCDIPQVTVRLLEPGDPQDHLLAFLSTRPVNPTLAGYFEKVLSMLLAKGPDVILNCLFGPKAAAEQLIELIDSPSLAQVLIRAVLCEGGSYIEERQAVMKRLAVKELKEGKCLAVSSTLVELINSGQSSVQWKELALALYCPEVISVLFALLSEAELTAKASSRVLTTLISNQFFRVAITRSQKTPEDATVTEEEELPEVLSAVLEGCAQVQKCLEKAQGGQIPAGFGEGDVETLGEMRLLCAEVVLALTRVDITQITVQLGKQGVYTALTNLFFRYNWNSFLHSCFYQLCMIIINSPVLDIRSTLTLDTNLVEQIANYEAEQLYPSGAKLRKGQRGFITRIASMLVKAAETHGDVEEVLSRVSAWQSYVETQLNPTLEIENKPGPDSRVQTHQTEEDEDFDVHLDAEQREGERFAFMFPGERESQEPQISDDFEEGIPVGEDLNVGDLETEELFDLNEKEPQFRACLRGNDAKEMRVEGEELEAAKARGQTNDTEEARDFNSRDYWRVPQDYSPLPDLD